MAFIVMCIAGTFLYFGTVIEGSFNRFRAHEKKHQLRYQRREKGER